MFLGGLGIFMYGVQTTSTGLQKFAANRLKEILQSLTQKSFLAVLFGIVMTVAFQSSTATTVLVVEFVNAGLMSLSQALGIVLGSALGTSISIQLIAFKMLNVAWVFIFIGFVLYIFVNKPNSKHLGQAMIGFGLIYVGMATMSDASAPLKEVPEVHTFLTQLGVKPFLGILVGLVLTALMQSSTATVAIVISLADQGLVQLGAVIPLVLGAHIGGTVTTLFSSLATQKQDARRAALANTLYKVIGTLLIFPFLGIIPDFLIWLSGDLKRQVANAHLVFSLFMIIVFLPLNPWIAKVMVEILPEPRRKKGEAHFQFIDESSLEVPTVALTQSRLEIRALGKRMRDEIMVKIPSAFLESKSTLSGRGAPVEKELDWYYRHISRFLTTLSIKEVSGEQQEEILHTQFILKEFQYIGDALLELGPFIQGLRRENPVLVNEIWGDVEELYQSVLNNYNRMIQSIKTWDRKLAGEVIREHPEIVRLQRALQFALLAQGTVCESPEGMPPRAVHWENLDVVNLLYRIDEHTVNIAQVIMGLV
jgi:phosphate:Na+ symporter